MKEVVRAFKINGELVREDALEEVFVVHMTREELDEYKNGGRKVSPKAVVTKTHTPRHSAQRVAGLYSEGLSIQDIARTLGLKDSSVVRYLNYAKKPKSRWSAQDGYMSSKVMEVAKLKQQGFSSRQVAKMIGIKKNTVDTYWWDYRKKNNM